VTQAVAQPDFNRPLEPPGGLMVWIFIFMELLAFGLAFIVFAVLRSTTGVNQFYDFYWLLTAFHLFHVLLGIAVLAYMASKVRRGEDFPAPDFNLKTGSAFWHMCDLIWVLLFPIFYLL